MEEKTSSTVVSAAPETTPEREPEAKPAEAAATPVAMPSKIPGWTGIICLCLIVSVASSVASIAAYDQWYAQKVVAVDLKGFITDQRDKFVAGKISEDELKRSFDRLEQVVTAIPKNKAVLMGDLVVRNVEIIKP
jgi:hypothetical protein